jgi:uncharacterized repeat protein (TIGR01451 family)
VIRRSIAVSAIVVLTLGLTSPATAADRASDKTPKLKPAPAATAAKSLDKGTVLSLGEGSGRQLYIVQLEDAAVPAYAGGVKNLNPVQAEGRTFSPDAAPEAAYRRHVLEEQDALRADIADLTGRPALVRFSYTDAVNGFAISLTRAEALKVSDLDGVAAVQVDEVRRLQTDRGPEWIGAPAIWSGAATPTGVGTKGEGIVAGVLDSGLNAANPSFADVVSVEDGGDGYDHENPLGAGTYRGVCDPANTTIFIADWGCNDKLIGAWDFAPADGTNPYDDNGHGTHTASTTVGNQLDATTFSAEETPADRFSATRNIKGVAPHANLIAYDVCSGGCPMSAILAGIDQAIDDDVDVINYSIGSSAASNPWTDPDAVGFLNARAAGIHVATSAGNDGPGAATLGSPGDVPWMTTVGATQHDRQWQASVQDITADGGQTLPDIPGLAFANATDGAFPLVYAGNAPYNNPLCGIDGGTAGDGTFPAGTDLTGLIIVCDRGGGGRVEKGQNVAGLGAEGMILANDQASGDSINADPHALPAVHVTFDDGTALKTWMGTVTGEQASLSGAQEFIGPEVADIMAGFSSRGPNRAVEMISPSLSAPGVDILAGNGADNEVSWGFISGTSMASPHIAGSLALLASANPDWTPAEAQSALMTTSVTEITDNDGTPADWFDMGSGRVDLNEASNAGLVLDETEADYLAADPTVGGDVKALNTASMADTQCLETCTWTRTVEATETGAGTWTAAGSAVTDGIDVTVEPAAFDLAAGESQEITVTADVAGSSTEEYQFGNVVLTPAAGSEASPAHLPVAALPSTGVFQDEIEVDTRRDAGSQESEPIEAVEITDLDISANGLVPADVQGLEIPEDGTNTDPYDGNGTETVLLTVPEGATRMIVNLRNATAPDFDLYVGKGTEPSAATEVALSASGGSAESVDIPLESGDAGEWWVLVQNWEASAPGGTDSVDLETAVVAGDAGNLTAEGPAAQPQGEPFTIRTFWDEPEMDGGETWYGSLTLDAAPGGTRIGTIPVTVNRLEDDVAKSVDADTAEPGDTLTYTVDVQPNVTGEDLTYTFEDTLPEGTTYVEGSGPEGATFEDGVLSWEAVLPTAVGVDKAYDVTSSANDESCVHPFSGEAEFVDLGALGIPAQPSIEGDSVVYTAFAADSFGFFEDTFDGLSFTDDGFLVYGEEDNYGGNPFINQELPEPALPNNLAAGLWQDMELLYDQGSDAGVRIAQAGDLKLIQFDGMRLAGDKSGRLGTTDFQVVQVAGTRDVYFAYDNVDGPIDDVTIGAENSAGDVGTALVNSGDATGVITDDTVVCMIANDLFEPQSFTYQVTVDEGVSDGQVLSNTLVHTTDDPGAQPVSVSRDVTVQGPELPAVTVSKVRDAREPSQNGVVVFRRPAGATGQRLTVEYLVNGNATPGVDYRPLDGEVAFGRNARIVREFIDVKNRPGRQGTRFVRIVVADGEGYQAGDPGVARVDILDARR